MIKEDYSNNNTEFLISIVVITFNHENYIKKCLDSILMQDINAKYEIIISDDCSSDKTQSIIKHYKDKYPNIINANLRKKNVGATKNQYECFNNSKGKYIAILDGDDFWTNKNKLKTQINFLEDNNEYIACTQRYQVIDEDNNITQKIFYGPGRPKSGVYTLKDFENYIYYGHQGTLVFKNIFLHPKYDYSIMYKADRWICDITLCMLLSAQGNIFVSDDNMTSYRRFQKKGASNYCSSIMSQNLIQERLGYLKTLETYAFKEMGIKIKHKDRMDYYFWWSMLYMLRYPSDKNWEALKFIHNIAPNKLKIYSYVLIRIPILPGLAFRHFTKRFRLK